MACLAWFLPVHLEHRRQWDSIAAIERLGGGVHTRSTAPEWLRQFQSDSQLGLFEEGIGPDWFRRYLPTPWILNHFLVVDEVWAKTHSNLTGESRYVARSAIADDDLAYFARFPGLESINLEETAVTGAGLRHLRGLKHLKELDLSRTRFSDEDTAALAELEHLEVLCLFGTRVGDPGLVALERLQHLQRLDVQQTQVTPRGLVSLRDRPDLRVSASVPWYTPER